MAKTPQEEMDEAIARAKQQVAEEVQDHQAEDKDLEKVSGGGAVGGEEDPLWFVGYKTTSDSFDPSSGSS